MESELPLSIDPANLAVILIDMQSGFINSEEKEQLIPRQVSVIRICRKKNIPLIVAKYYDEGGIVPELQEEIKTISSEHRYEIVKHYDSAFRDTELDLILQKLGIKRLLLMGINACACVLQTARDATSNGYEVITSDLLIAGCCSSCNAHEVDSWYTKNGKFFRNQVPLFQS